MDERRFGTGSPGRFEHVQSAEGVHFKIQEGYGGGAVMRGLGSRMNDQLWTEFLDERQHSLPVTNIEVRMLVVRNLATQPSEHPPGISFGAKKDRAMITVDTGHMEALA